MTPEQFDIINRNLKETVESSVKMYVNGKIDRLNDKIDVYIKEDNEWKTLVMPEIEAVANVRGFGKVTVGLLAIGGTIVGIIAGIIKIIKG